MISFKDFYNNLLFEGKVKKYENFIHLLDLPMFSVFFDKEIFKNDDLMKFSLVRRFERDQETESAVSDFLDYIGPKIKEICGEARNIIGKMGFSRMHSNLVFTDNSEMINFNTGKVGGVAGYARVDKHYMSMDFNYFLKYRDDYPNILIETIVHEWAHLWMFQNSKAFKKTIKELYTKLVLNKENLYPEIEKEYENKLFIKVIDPWKRYLNYISEKISRNLLKKLDINDETIELVPHGLSVRGKLKENVNDSLLKGQDVYCEKGNTMWLVGYYDRNHRRHEITIPLNDLNKLNSTIQTDFNNIEDAIKNSLLNLSENLSENEIEEIIKSNIKEFFIHIKSYEYITVPDEIKEKIFNEYENYIKNAVLDVMNNFSSEEIIKFLKDKNYQYDILWVNNKTKPKDVSISKILKPYAIKRLIDQKDTKYHLMGKENDELRNYVNNQIKWVDSYGMSNDDELWATAIDRFFKLPNEHKKVIIDLINNKVSSNYKKTYKQKEKPLKPSSRRKEFKQKIHDKLKSLIEPERNDIVGDDGGLHELRVMQLIDRTIRDLKIKTKSKLLSNALYNSVIEIIKTPIDDYIKKRLKHMINKEVEKMG